MATQQEIIKEIGIHLMRLNQLVKELQGDVVVSDEERKKYEERELEVKVSKLLHELGIPAHIKGYIYLKTAIILCVNDSSYLNGLTTRLYPSIAKEYDSTASKVERAIRWAISWMHKKKDIEELKLIYDSNVDYTTTNLEFIATIVEKLLLEK